MRRYKLLDNAGNLFSTHTSAEDVINDVYGPIFRPVFYIQVGKNRKKFYYGANIENQIKTLLKWAKTMGQDFGEKMKNITTEMVLKYNPCWVYVDYGKGVKRIQKILGKNGKKISEIIKMRSIDTDDKLWLLTRDDICDKNLLKFLYLFLFQYTVKELEKNCREDYYFLNFVSQEITAILMKNTTRSRIKYLKEVITNEVNYGFYDYNERSKFGDEKYENILCMKIFIYNFLKDYDSGIFQHKITKNYLNHACDYLPKYFIHQCIKQFCFLVELYEQEKFKP